MRIGFLTQYYPPEVGAPQARISELARHFRERDHEVVVLAAMPNYPVGRIYPGFGGVLDHRNENGIDVFRTYVYATQKASLLQRLTNYGSFAVSAGFAGTWLLPKLDYLFVESPPLFLGPSGVWLSKIKAAKMIFNVSDLWPESAVHVGVVRRGSAAFAASEWLEGSLYRAAWVVSGQSKTIVDTISSRFPSVRTYHLSNGADTRRFSPGCSTPAMRRLLAPNGECSVLYAGLHGLAQGLDQIVEAASLLAGTGDGCRFVFVGDGPMKASLSGDAARLGLKNVSFLDPVPSKDMPGLVASADIVVIPLKKYIPGAIPSKLYEAMAAQRPVIYVGAGEGAEIVRDAGAGIVVEPGNVAAIADAVRTLAGNPMLREEMGACGRGAAVRRFDRSSIAYRFLDFLEQCLRSPSSA